jgi:hypothetical protein
MSRERSYFEHNGMPLHAAPNSGHVRRLQEPWLGSFTTHVSPTEQKTSGTAGVTMPNFAEEVAIMNEEAEGSAPQSSSRAQRSTEEKPTAAIQLGADPLPPHDISAAASDAHSAQDNPVNPAIEQSILPVIHPGLLQSKPTNGTDIKPAVRMEADTPNRVTESVGARTVASDAPSLPASVPVQKPVTVQTEISSLPMPVEFTTALPGKPFLPLIGAMGAPLSVAVAAATENSGTLMPDETAAALFPASVPVHFEAARVPMGGGDSSPGTTAPVAAPESQPQSYGSQQALLDRLNDRAASLHQQSGGGRRVHIGNLRITVQRPAMEATQTPPSAPSAQPQAAPPAPILFNPWERLYTAFD